VGEVRDGGVNMTRREEIVNAVRNTDYPSDPFMCFILGAEWADRNPDNSWKERLKFEREELLDKACDWLEEHADGYTWYNELEGESGMTEDFIEEFRNAINE